MENWQDRVVALLDAETDDLVELAHIAGCPPRTFYRDANFRRADLTAQPRLVELDLSFSLLEGARVPEPVLQVSRLRRRIAEVNENHEPLLYSNLRIELADILLAESLRTGSAPAADEAAHHFRRSRDVRQHALGDTEITLRLATALLRQASLGDNTRLSEARSLLENALIEMDATTAPRLRDSVVRTLAEVAVAQAMSPGHDEHGLADLTRAMLRAAYLPDDRVDKATTLSRLGAELLLQAGPIERPALSRLVLEAGETIRAALRTLTRDAHPVQWAATMQNLASALQTQGSRTAGATGTRLLAEAADAYRAALEVRTRADHPAEWAMTMQNLAVALENQGCRTAGAEGTRLLAEAAEAYRAALEVRTRADNPVEWAMTMQNLAGALQAQGSRTAGAEGTLLLAEAAEAYRAALEVATRADNPVHRATTHENLAMLHATWAEHPACDDPGAQLRAALMHADAALEVTDRDSVPDPAEKARRLRADILQALER
jgi:tetratricopeptide (TPR) repeat protein